LSRRDFLRIVQRHQQSGVVLDTNALGFLILPSHRTPADWRLTKDRRGPLHRELVNLACDKVTRWITTPHILTEMSYFISKAPEHLRRELTTAFRLYIAKAKEKSMPAKSIAPTRWFDRLGLADSSQLMLGRPLPLFLTDDTALSIELENHGRSVIGLRSVEPLEE
ncbi:MAG: hypothetical protein KC492_24215, partial [Myxococcales bacterium]|nr:hypothetical protein [Myxococcales bacterium]